jgi:CAAX protease family protein
MRRDMARPALRAIVLWTAVEFTLRDGGVVLLAWLLLPRPFGTFPWEDVVRFSASMHVVAMVILGGMFVRRLSPEGLSWREIGYDPSRKMLVAGVLGGAALVALTNGTALLDYEIFHDPVLLQFARAVRMAGYAAQGALVFGNGILTPLVEELAWRGYIQTRLAFAWPSDLALVVTALGFALKHVIVDLSMTRITTIVTAALILGFIRAHYGTMASTVAHLAMNLPSTLLLILQDLSTP